MKRSRLSRKIKFVNDRRLRVFSLTDLAGEISAQGEDYDDLMAKAGVEELDNEVTAKRKLVKYMRSAGVLS